jgi:multidrug efflux pump
LAITSDTMPLTDVQNLVNTRLAQKISQVSGVGLVTLAGGQRPAVRIQADTQALAAKGIGIDTLRSAIAAANANSAKGSFDGPTRGYNINANDQLLTAADYSNLIVTYKNDAPVRLAEVARVVDSAENTQLGAWAGMPCVSETAPKTGDSGACGGGHQLPAAIVLNVQRQPGANVIRTVDAIKAQLPLLQAQLPASLRVQELSDRTTGIRASVMHVQLELVLAVVMVVLVIFFFLHSVRATVIASIAVPISLIGTCGVMYLLGYSLNNLSLMALTIATGFVVDDAIVMLENISRHLEVARKVAVQAHAGAATAPAPDRSATVILRAAMEGASQIGFTIISLTVSLIAVLIPLLFMGDVVGRLFREFAVSLAITILISAVVSLTLVPMMSARWLGDSAHHGGRFGAAVQRFFDRVIAGYDRWLGVVLRHQRITLLVALGTLLLTVLLYIVIPKGLFPTQDTGQLQARIEAVQGVSYPRMRELQLDAAQAILADPAVSTLASFVGVDAANNTMLHTGRMLVNLKPKSQRDDQDVVMQRLRERVGRVAGVTLYLQPTQDLTIDAETGPTEFRFSLEGADTPSVTNAALALVARLRDVPELRHAVTDAGATAPAAYVDIDRDTASRLGITAASIDDALYSAFGQRIVSTIFTETNQYRVILESRPGVLTTPDALGTLRLKAGNGSSTPLSAIATVRELPAPLQVTHVAQFPATTVGFDTAPGVALGKAVDAIRRTAKEMNLPAGVSLTFLGAAGAYEGSLANELWLILAAVVCVYIVLGVLYESYIHPLTILSTLPSAGVGALLALMIGGHDLGVIGIIGIILLIGIVKKNAIMMIDFAIDAEREQGKPPVEAIRQAALLRFRPILMTTLAALFAALPLMFGWGEGAELRRPLGLAIFGGLVLSQLLTLFTTPVIYLGFDRLGQRWRARRERRMAPVQAP